MRSRLDLKELMLQAPKLTLAAAESMTCGQVQATVGAISGASEFFLGGITTYTLDQKVKHLRVNRAAARKVNCVSPRVAEEMATGVCALFGSDIGIATTGYAEASPARQVREPFAWWALVHRQRGKIVALRNGRVECVEATRVEAQRIVAEAVIAELTEYLRELRA